VRGGFEPRSSSHFTDHQQDDALSGVSSQRKERKERKERKGRKERKNRKLQPIGTELSSFLLNSGFLRFK